MQSIYKKSSNQYNKYSAYIILCCYDLIKIIGITGFYLVFYLFLLKIQKNSQVFLCLIFIKLIKLKQSKKPSYIT